MSTPQRKINTNLESASKEVEDGIAQNRPDWVDEQGECSACTSMSHELADPTSIPEEILKNSDEKAE